jgi:hypothetical protein
VNRVSRLHILTVGVIVCLATAAFAQSEKVDLRMVPKPGQTVRLTMTQDMDMDMSFDGAAALPGLAPMKMATKTTMTMTQKTGALKPDGTMEAEITYDQITTDATVNGQSISTGGNDALTGKTVTVKYNRNGEIVDITGFPDVGLTADSLKQMMSPFQAGLPVAPLAVGEMFSTPVNFSFPLPLAGSSPLNVSGETRTTLVSVDKDAVGRSARLEAVTAGTMTGNIASPDDKNSMRFDLTMSGTATNVLDLDRGVLRSATSSNTMSGKMEMGGAAPAQMPPMRLQATTKITITSN